MPSAGVAGRGAPGGAGTAASALSRPCPVLQQFFHGRPFRCVGPHLSSAPGSPLVPGLGENERRHTRRLPSPARDAAAARAPSAAPRRPNGGRNGEPRPNAVPARLPRPAIPAGPQFLPVRREILVGPAAVPASYRQCTRPERITHECCTWLACRPVPGTAGGPARRRRPAARDRRAAAAGPGRAGRGRRHLTQPGRRPARGPGGHHPALAGVPRHPGGRQRPR